MCSLCLLFVSLLCVAGLVLFVACNVLCVVGFVVFVVCSGLLVFSFLLVCVFIIGSLVNVRCFVG